MQQPAAQGIVNELSITLRYIEASFTMKWKSAMTVEKDFAERQDGRMAVQCGPDPCGTGPLDAEDYESRWHVCFDLPEGSL
jgi:hypothetical protein